MPYTQINHHHIWRKPKPNGRWIYQTSPKRTGKQCVTHTVISARDKLIQLRYLHRIYFTPKILFLMRKRTSPTCQKCDTVQGDFLHMVWSCTEVRPFCSAITAFILEVFEFPNICNTKWCLLGVFDPIQYKVVTFLSKWWWSNFWCKVVLIPLAFFCDPKLVEGCFFFHCQKIDTLLGKLTILIILKQHETIRKIIIDLKRSFQ